MTAVTQAPPRETADGLEAVTAAGIALAATLPPMSPQAAARLAGTIAAAAQQDGDGR
jgi:hypothetical protein